LLRSLLASILASLSLLAGLSSAASNATRQIEDPRSAFQAAVNRLIAQTGQDYTLGELHIAGNWAYAVAEPVAGRIPALANPHAFVPLIGIHEASGWQIIAPSPGNASEFNALLDNLPAQLMDEHTKAFLQQPELFGTRPHNALNFSGHKLPWPKGQIAYAFSKDAPGHVNQVDFDIRGLAASGDVLASKPGTVVFVKESSSAGACTFSAWKQANMVVVQNGPNEYSWYVHLAFNSVPVSVGDAVSSGARLGIEGSTGFACGVHVHFMVSTGHTSWTNPSDPNEAPWASTNSLSPVDFVEVPWGAIQNSQTYTSQNEDVPDCLAPSLQSPPDDFVSPSRNVSFTWSSVTGCEFSGYTLRLKDMPDMDSGGATLGQTAVPTNELSATLTVSSSWYYRDLHWGVKANGPGASWAMRRLRVEPVITGTWSIFSDTNFAGDVFTSTQTITDLSAIDKDDWARSLKLDAGVAIVACVEPNFHGACGRASGPAEYADLDALAMGLRGGLSSVRACAEICPPGAITPTPTAPISGQVVLSGTHVNLVWQGAAKDDAYRGELWGGVISATIAWGWITQTQRAVGPLLASDQPYRWRVRASNGFGDSGWAEESFVVTPAQNLYVPVVLRS
jgi:hypothetical protein